MITKQEDTFKTKQVYFKLPEQRKHAVNDLDYTVLERQKPDLQKIADIGNSMVSIFDSHKKKHVFNSSNWGAILGYNQQEIERGGEHFLETKIHPDDFITLDQNASSIFKLIADFSIDEKLNYKLVSEHRILDANNNYVRVIEQHRILELDNNGNVWLALSILDISPYQKNMGKDGVISELVNFRTGKIIPFIKPTEEITITLTKREIEVLKLVRDGFLSKEISDKLTISLYTVNTYRQRVLEKLGVNNSIEAVTLASRLGLI